MRAQGPVEDVPAASSGDHLCWIYEDDADLGAAAREFLTGGLDRGERLLCVGLPPAVPHLDELIARGAVQSLGLDEVYAAWPFDPDRQLAYYDAATRGARDDGYSGLRVLADISDLAADDGQRAQLMRWEQLADGYAVHGAGFSAMCAYRADLPHETLAHIAAVHPLVHGEPSAFRLFADQDGIALAGSVDTFCSDRLARALDAAPVAEGGVVLDLARLEFLDIAACRTLAQWAAGLAARSLVLEIAGSSHLFRRMWQLLDLELVAPVTYGSRPT